MHFCLGALRVNVAAFRNGISLDIACESLKYLYGLPIIMSKEQDQNGHIPSAVRVLPTSGKA